MNNELIGHSLHTDFRIHVTVVRQRSGKTANWLYIHMFQRLCVSCQRKLCASSSHLSTLGGTSLLYNPTMIRLREARLAFAAFILKILKEKP